jgi:ribonuclease J
MESATPGAPSAPRSQRSQSPRGKGRFGGARGPRRGGGGGGDRGAAIHPRPRRTPRNQTAGPATTDDHLRFVALGGLEEIGRNMMFVEFKNDIVAMDAGLQFPEEATPGVDFIIPNVTYLEKKKHNVKALIITHAHYDHIGAIPFVMGKIGNPPLYTSALSAGIIKKRQEDYPNAPKLNIQIVKPGDTVKISENVSIEFFTIEHTIPDCLGIIMKTPVGNFVNLGDFKIEYDEQGIPYNLDVLKRVGDMGVHVFATDSTNADILERSPSERLVEKNLEELFKKASGRIIVAMFASVLTRIAEVIKIAEKLGRKVVLNGYSMKSNVQIAQNLGYIKAAEGTIIPMEDVHKYRDDKVLILSTGAQGESNAGIMKILTGEHRFISIKLGDTVILSSSVIPGNERAVQTIKDDLARQGAIIYHSNIVDIHSSGHAAKEDLKLAMATLRPKFLFPVHGYYYKRFINAQNGVEAGIPKENIFLMDNGQVAEITKDRCRITEEQVPASYVFVDGLGVGDVEEVVLRDRRSLAAEGMIVVILAIDRKKGGKLIKNPDIISRGFIYLKENQEILEGIRKRIRGLIERLPQDQEIESDYLKTLLRDQIGQFIFTKTKRRPMILPVVIEL